MAHQTEPSRTKPPSNFHPIILADMPTPFRAAPPQADNFPRNKMGAGDSSSPRNRAPFIRYTSVFMKSLRFTPACTSRPDGLPAVPGITPGVRCESPPPPPPPAMLPMVPPMPMLVFMKAPPVERMFHMYAHAVPVPYMRTFGTNDLYKQHQYGQLPYHMMFH